MREDLWRGPVISPEPPPAVMAAQDGQGYIADRLLEPCEYCGDGVGSIWRWRHNGRSECWLDIDGIGPWVEVRQP
jgi:hypothetical protein